MELFLLVLIGDFPLLHRGVPRWLLLLLNSEIYFHRPRSLTSAADSRNLMSFDELHVLLRREHRIGLCQWRELIIRRMRNRFLGGGFPRDFEATSPPIGAPVLKSGDLAHWGIGATRELGKCYIRCNQLQGRRSKQFKLGRRR